MVEEGQFWVAQGIQVNHRRNQPGGRRAVSGFRMHVLAATAGVVANRTCSARRGGTGFRLPPERCSGASVPTGVDVAGLEMRGRHPIGPVEVFGPRSRQRGTRRREGHRTNPKRTGSTTATVTNVDVVGRSGSQTRQRVRIGGGCCKRAKIDRTAKTTGHVPEGSSARGPAQSGRRCGNRTHS